MSCGSFLAGVCRACDEWLAMTTQSSRVRDRSRSPPGRREGNPRANQVYIGNVPYDSTTTQVKAFFDEEVGVAVDRVNLLMDRETGRARGCGFVTFSAPEAAIAVERANGCGANPAFTTWPDA